MTGAELRVIDGKNILDLNDEELRRAKDELDRAGLQVVSIASPLLKCVLEGGPELDRRFEHDAFASKHTFADQPRLTKRAVQVAHFFGARIIRVFSYWRTVEPECCYAAIAQALIGLAGIAQREDLVFAIENEHACNVGTGAETASLLELVEDTGIAIVWDPANALVAGEVPFPDGYAALPKNRIVHVHAKDCDMLTGKPAWGPLGTRHVKWKEQIERLIADGYQGYLSLETHWAGPEGDRLEATQAEISCHQTDASTSGDLGADRESVVRRSKLEASRICGWNLRGLAAS